MPCPWKLNSALLLCAVLLGGCGMLDTSRKVDKPPVTRVGAAGPVVMVTDERTGSPVDLRADQQLTVRLRFAGATQSDWTLVGFEPGVLTEVGPTRYEQDLTAAAYGEIAGTQVWRFRPMRPGEVALHFELRMPRSRQPASQTASFDVRVR